MLLLLMEGRLQSLAQLVHSFNQLLVIFPELSYLRLRRVALGTDVSRLACRLYQVYNKLLISY